MLIRKPVFCAQAQSWRDALAAGAAAEQPCTSNSIIFPLQSVLKLVLCPSFFRPARYPGVKLWLLVLLRHSPVHGVIVLFFRSVRNEDIFGA